MCSMLAGSAGAAAAAYASATDSAAGTTLPTARYFFCYKFYYANN